MNERHQHFGEKNKWKGESWPSRAEWDGLYLLRWLLTRSKPVCPSEPREDSAEGLRIGSWELGVDWRRIRQRSVWEKAPPGPHFIWSNQVITPTSPLQEMGDLVWRNGGEEFSEKCLWRFPKPKGHEFLHWQEPMSAQHNEQSNTTKFQNLKENKSLEPLDSVGEVVGMGLRG